MSIKSIALIALGSLSLALGMFGLFLPVLPTTPFLLLSSFCFLRSSEKLHKWLLSRMILGSYIHHYITYRAISFRAKIFSVVFLWATLTISILLINSWIMRAGLVVVGFAVSIHLFMLKTIKKYPIGEDMNAE